MADIFTALPYATQVDTNLGSSAAGVAAKGTVRNKEIFRRSHYVELGNADIQVFYELVDLWVLEYAEQYAAK